MCFLAVASPKAEAIELSNKPNAPALALDLSPVCGKSPDVTLELFEAVLFEVLPDKTGVVEELAVLPAGTLLELFNAEFEPAVAVLAPF